MLTWTDIIILVVLTLYVANGAYQGFVRSLVGPLAFILGSLMGWVSYLINKNMVLALIIALVAPFLLGWIANTILRMKLGPAGQLSLTSRVAGGGLMFLWGGSIAVLTLLFLTLLPFENFNLLSVKKDMDASFTYRGLALVLKNLDLPDKVAAPSAEGKCLSGLCGIDETDYQDLGEDKDIQALMDDPRMQAIANDPELRDAIERKDIPTLLKHPAIMELSSDPSFVIKALKVYPKIKAATATE